MLRNRFALVVVDVDEALGFSENAGYIIEDRWNNVTLGQAYDDYDEAFEVFTDFVEEVGGHERFWDCDCVGPCTDCGYWELGHP
jgi:hypothetical protein